METPETQLAVRIVRKISAHVAATFWSEGSVHVEAGRRPFGARPDRCCCRVSAPRLTLAP